MPKSRGLLVAGIVLCICCLALLTGLSLQSAMSSVGSSEQASSVSAGNDDASGDDVSNPEDVTENDTWNLDFFDDIRSVYSITSNAVRWVPREADEEWNFSITDSATGETAYYQVQDFDGSVEDEDVYIWGKLASLDEELSEEYGEGVFVEAGDVEPDYTFADAAGSEAGYTFTEALALAANDGHVVIEAIRNEMGSDSDHYFLDVNEYGFTEAETKSVSITPDGEAIAKGKLYVYFKPSTLAERIRAIVNELGCSFLWGDDAESFLYEGSEGGYVDSVEDAVSVCVGVGTPDDEDEWDVAEKFEAYPAVIEACTDEARFDTAY